ncbi:MAG: type II toxin-antitoxin system PemK/MazF family toxin [Pyrinomonadaceae bacterium]
MKNKIVWVPFPFDDLSSSKARPAVCLTRVIKLYDHIVLAFITSRISNEPSSTDLVIELNDRGFAVTGLKVASTIRLHRLMTISRKMIRRELGIGRALSKSTISYQNKNRDWRLFRDYYFQLLER